MPLVVLDTSVLITAAISPSGGAAKLLQYAQKGRIALALSPKLHDELESRLMGRERFRRWLTVEQAQNYVDAIALLGTWFEDRPDAQLPQICRDPDDNFVIALHQDSDATMLVSNDKHILDVQYPNVFVRNVKQAIEEIEYQHEWGDQYVPGNFEESVRQIEGEGSAGIIAAYAAFAQITDHRAVDLLPVVVVPETHQAFVNGFDQVHGMLQDRGMATRPHFASPEVAYVKLPPNPRQNVRVTTDAPLPTGTIFATMQHCPDQVDLPGCDFGNWRVFGIGEACPPEQVPPRPRSST